MISCRFRTLEFLPHNLLKQMEQYLRSKAQERHISDVLFLATMAFMEPLKPRRMRRESTSSMDSYTSSAESDFDDFSAQSEPESEYEDLELSSNEESEESDHMEASDSETSLPELSSSLEASLPLTPPSSSSPPSPSPFPSSPSPSLPSSSGPSTLSKKGQKKGHKLDLIPIEETPFAQSFLENNAVPSPIPGKGKGSWFVFSDSPQSQVDTQYFSSLVCFQKPAKNPVSRADKRQNSSRKFSDEGPSSVSSPAASPKRGWGSPKPPKFYPFHHLGSNIFLIVTPFFFAQISRSLVYGYRERGKI